MAVLTDALDRHARERPEALAVADGDLRFTWRTLREAVDAAADRYRRAGVRPGERIALIARDGAPALVLVLAALRSGGVHVPIDHQLAVPESEAIRQTLEPAWRVRLPAGGVAEDAELTRLAAGGPDPLPAPGSAYIRSSSGTTGAAKGVLLGHRRLQERIAAAIPPLGIHPGDRVLWLLPMAYHVAVSLLLYVEVGAAVVFGNHLRAGVTAAIARRHQVTMAYGNPYHVRRLAGLPPGEDLPPSLAQMISTTTALDAQVGAAWRQRHGIPLRQALGIIEVGLPFVSPGDAGEAVGALGAPAGAFRARILGPDGRSLSAGHAGELALAGPGLFDAYLAPYRPASDVLTDGFFRTGDCACMDEAGRVTLLGRLKDVINVGGFKVFPLEVEAVLLAHPQVAQARVRPMPDAHLGEQVSAEVEVREGVDPALAVAELGRWCAERLAPAKRPAAIQVLAQLPLTGSGKVRR